MWAKFSGSHNLIVNFEQENISGINSDWPIRQRCGSSIANLACSSRDSVLDTKHGWRLLRLWNLFNVNIGRKEQAIVVIVVDNR